MTWREFVARVAVALALGTAIGIEREWRPRTAGLRTNALVSTGSALFVMLGAMAPGEISFARIPAPVVSGD